MTDTLLHAYLPLFLWTGLGLIAFRFLPDALPRFLGRSLYWVGVPLEILALARQTDFSAQVSLAPLITIVTLLTALPLAWSILQGMRSVWKDEGGRMKDENGVQPTQATDQSASSSALSSSPTPRPSFILQSSPFQDPPWETRSRRGSFLLSSIIGNTGFVGLAIAPAFVSSPYLSWIVFYGVTHNVVGTYGIGVFLASYYSRHLHNNRWWMQLRDVLTVPSLWAFAIGFLTHSVPLPSIVELGLRGSVWLVIPAALLLMGMRISQLQGWKSLRLAIVPAVLKVLVIPGLVGLVTTLFGLAGEARLAVVLMSGMPSAFAGLILAEEYELDRELIASSIVVSTGLLLLAIPLWLRLFGSFSQLST
ncbi:MAG: AEC family transporter [Cyanobacteria bacterium CRU_2_1]|nr:AEC family transporter [Cyanobacteria bacterium RU_5_0]NJR61177.1 AEC family transporter [Cyanobacteria bacterium CRU_2_1]